jgi:hypothetical protein
MKPSHKAALAGLAVVCAGTLAAPHAARAYRSWEQSRKDAWIALATAAVERGDEILPPMPWGLDLADDDDEKRGIEKDDPRVRRLVDLITFGKRTPEYQHELLLIAAEENRKAAALTEHARRQLNARTRQVFDPAAPALAGVTPTPATLLQWNNVGPAGARSQFNGSYYKGEDSGRPTAIRVDPTDNNTVYLALSGGGLWKTSNFQTGLPTWTPLTDTLGALALGAMDIDPNNHLTIYIGTGDAFDQQGGSVLKSIDGGQTWGAPVLVTGIHPLFGGFRLTAGSIRSLLVDPSNSNQVYVATNVGFFVSSNGGATFTVIDLPNGAAYNWGPTSVDLEATWDVVYLGAAGGKSTLMVSGVWACPGFFPNNAGGGTAPCPNGGVGTPAGGMLGDIWTSADGGVTWTSARVQGLLPTQAASWGLAGSDSAGLGDLGRIALGAAPNADPTQATVYAEGGSTIEIPNGKTTLLFGTRNGGATWSKMGTPLSTNLTNPTLAPFGGAGDCPTLDLGHVQSYYNLAVAVDPGNPNRAIMGGNLCSVRTIDGGATWQNTSHWLPSSGQGDTADGAGSLGYVHADWHTITASRIGGKFMLLAGTDGGIFSSYDIFDAAPAQLGTWFTPDIGLITHLAYGHGTGDPTLGNAQVLYAGFQDNGTRWRLSQTEFIDLNTVKNFDQISGGDGTGASVASDPNGQNQIYWGSVQNRRKFCRPANRDCGIATHIADGTEIANWFNARIPSIPGGDGEPFVERFSATFDAASSMISATNANVWKITVDANDKFTYVRLTPNGVFGRGIQNQMVHVSPWTYSIAGTPTRIYGVVTSGGRYSVLSDTGSGTPALVQMISTMHINANTTANQVLGASTVAFPRNPVNLGGTDIRQTGVGASLATTTAAGGTISAALGHIFKTVDGGNTWIPIHGPDSGAGSLPNIPVYVVRFDYGDPSDQTLYAGTELGLYRTTDGGNTWARYGAIPAVRVTDISVALNGSLVRVSTYGRGLWEIFPHSEAAAGPGTGDWDGNGVIDFLDLHALASRIGTTAGSNIQTFPVPQYDSTVDLTGNPSAIEDADLQALLAKFGSTP